PAGWGDGDQRLDRDVTGRSELAGEPLRFGRADAFERARLIRAGRRTVRGAVDHAHPTGRATRASAADRLVRDPVAAARLEHGPAARHDDLAIRIGDADHGIAPALVESADETQRS